ncbi:MAG TPA: DMT family transporter [Vitreimonas sp.]|nr:DMT family transporter [Vitreimonas sp.]
MTLRAASSEAPAPVGFAAAIVAACLFAWLAPLSRWAYDLGMEPLPFVAWRAGIGVLALVAFIAVAGRRGRALVSPRSLSRREASSLGLAAVMGLALNLSIFGAFDRVSVALALIGFYTYPTMVATVAIVLRREEPSPAVLAALALASLGMVLVVAGSLGSPDGRAVDPVGILLALAAAASQTVFVTVSRDGYARVPAEQAIVVVLATSLAGSLVIGFVAGMATPLGAPIRQPDLLPIVIAAGVAGAAVPSLLFLSAIRLIGGTRSGILMLLEPVVGVGLAAWLLGEGLAAPQVAGGMAVLGAAYLLQRAHRRAGSAADAPVAAHEAVPGPPRRR